MFVLRANDTRRRAGEEEREVTKYTPGPWSRLESPWPTNVIVPEAFPDAEYIAVTDRSTDEWEANASLVAAAPDMLEALEFLWEECTVATESENNAFRNAQEIIAKARGVVK